ncbi:unnamed protein product [Amaranthus hypochondriacus]
MNTPEFDFDSPVIKALGSLFKLTEVHLRDDGCSKDDIRQASSFSKHIRFTYDDDDDGDDYDVNGISKDNSSSNTSVETSEESVIMEDADLSQEMSALGLPLSFQTSKQSSAQTKGKHKATQLKNQNSQNKLRDQVLISAKLSEEGLSYVEFQDKTNDSSSLSLLVPDELSCLSSDVSDGSVKSSNVCDGSKPAYMADETDYCGCEKQKHENAQINILNEALIDDLLGTDFQMENKLMSTAGTSVILESNTSSGRILLDGYVEEHPMSKSLMEHVDIKDTEMCNGTQLDDFDRSICTEQIDDMPIYSEMVHDHDVNDIISSSVCDEWSVFWDSFYMRYYFYNSKTQESTWNPPPGMENCVQGDISNVNDISNTVNEQFDRHKLVDKTGTDGQTGVQVWRAQELTSEDLSSCSAMISDISCAIDVNDHHVHDGESQDGLIMASSPSTISHQHLGNEREQEDSYGMCNGKFLSKDSDSIGIPRENTGKAFSGNVIAQLSDTTLSSAVEAVCDYPIDDLQMEEPESVINCFSLQDTPATTKRKKKRKNRRKKSFNKNIGHEFQPVEDYYVDISKYWCQRYLLFSKFDDGIQMDEEGWFSVTPEAIARHHASRSGGGFVIDCFAGVGGNAIQFAKTSKHVIAVDIDSKKIDFAHQNATIYGVEDKIDFVNGDCFSLAPNLKADTVFLSPPWGGPDYLKVKSYDISMLQPHDGQYLFNTFKTTASFIIMFLPRNVDIVQLAELSLSCDAPWSLEVEKNFLNGKLKAVTAYFSKTS